MVDDISMGEEYLDEHAYEIITQEEFEDLLEETRTSLSKKSDRDLLKAALKQGKLLNKVTEHFPAYDVAERLLNEGWTPTPKQRQAIINVTAFYIAYKDKEIICYESEYDIDPGGALMNITYDFLNFEEIPVSTKTKRFEVKNKLYGSSLGFIKWYAPWRKYCFFVKGDLVFDAGCLEDIQNFINNLMKDWRDYKKLKTLKHGLDIESIEGM